MSISSPFPVALPPSIAACMTLQKHHTIPTQEGQSKLDSNSSGVMELTNCACLGDTASVKRDHHEMQDVGIDENSAYVIGSACDERGESRRRGRLGSMKRFSM